MNWKNLKTNPPSHDCEILCRIDYGNFRETFLARWFCDRGQRTFCLLDRYSGIMRGTTKSVHDANDNTLYIILDDIKL